MKGHERFFSYPFMNKKILVIIHKAPNVPGLSRTILLLTGERPG
jgi:hypothetical protein